MFLEKQYEIIKDCPKAIDWEEYCNKIIEEYNNLLISTNDELTFQTFLKKIHLLFLVHLNYLEVQDITLIWIH